MRWLLILAALAAVPALAGEARFPPARLVASSIHATPEPVRRFLGTLRRLERDGAFEPGRGMEPRDDLDGRSAKDWLLAHVAEDFTCRRDFGGLCEGTDPRRDFAYVFLSDEGWGALEGTPDAATPEGLAQFGFGFREMIARPELASGEGEHCLPAIARIEPDLDTVMTAALGSDGPGMLEAYDNFIAVNGRYRVRARPSVRGRVVNRIDHEVVFLPGPGETIFVREDDAGRGWTYVVPGDGPTGFAALDAADMLAVSAVAQAQICLEERGGRVVITARVGAGD